MSLSLCFISIIVFYELVVCVYPEKVREWIALSKVFVASAKCLKEIDTKQGDKSFEFEAGFLLTLMTLFKFIPILLFGIVYSGFLIYLLFTPAWFYSAVILVMGFAKGKIPKHVVTKKWVVRIDSLLTVILLVQIFLILYRR